MQKLIDMHTHILPNVDDGAQSMETALEMLKMEERQGVEKIILTPHFVSGKNKYTNNFLEERFNELCESAEENDIKVSLALGNECLYSSDLVDALEKGSAHTLGEDHVLVEFVPKETEEKIIKGCRILYNNGYRVILAHIERYEAFDKELAYTLKEMDVEFQMNADTAKMLCTPLALGKKRWLKSLLRSGDISYIATDAHDTERRKPELYANTILAHIPEHAEAMLFHNAARLLP